MMMFMKRESENIFNNMHDKYRNLSLVFPNDVIVSADVTENRNKGKQRSEIKNL